MSVGNVLFSRSTILKSENTAKLKVSGATVSQNYMAGDVVIR